MIRRPYPLVAFLACVLLTSQLVPAKEDPAKQADVTKQVASQLKDNKLVFTANNDLLGDPSTGDTKTLRIVYTDGDKTITRLFAENSNVNISATPGNTLTVTKATYGVLEGQVDVTEKVKAALKDNALSIGVDNDTLGCDPAPGVVKQLTVNYTIDSVAQTVSANEGDTLTIAKPEGDKKLAITQASYGPPEPTTAP